MAIDVAMDGVLSGAGGPFGSVIVKDGIIVGTGHNNVLAKNDPTRHGEMEAIRNACFNLGTFALSGCELYTTSEPCAMCLAGCMWARLDKVYYGCTCEDAADIGFDDSNFDKALGIDRNKVRADGFLIPLPEKDRNKCLDLFNEYVNTTDERY